MLQDFKEYSLYIHFPICRKKCRYCDFYSVPYNLELVYRFLESLKKELLTLQKKYHLKNIPVSTIYCGGGTPSLLTPQQWNFFCSEIIDNCILSDNIEWTIECNPDSFSEIKANNWLDRGVTRLNIGIQSLNNRELSLLGRIHTSEQALSILNNPILKKFKCVGADVMYGIPGQSPISLKHTLEKILSINSINHISVYELTISSSTPFGYHRKILPLPTEDKVVEMNALILAMVRAKGFEQYEVSNYAKPGYESLHNQAYWFHKPYLGIGPSAHSYLQPKRFSNIANMESYILKIVNKNNPQDFSEHIDKEKLGYEMILLGLRTTMGLNENTYYKVTGLKFNSDLREKMLVELMEKNYLQYKAPYWRLSDKGLMFADAITRKLV